MQQLKYNATHKLLLSGQDIYMAQLCIVIVSAATENIFHYLQYQYYLLQYLITWCVDCSPEMREDFLKDLHPYMNELPRRFNFLSYCLQKLEIILMLIEILCFTVSILNMDYACFVMKALTMQIKFCLKKSVVRLRIDDRPNST